MQTEDLVGEKAGFVGPTFTLSNRLKRTAWQLTWSLLARWTPPFAHRWRIVLLNLFGARVSPEAYVYPNVQIWAPWNLQIDRHGTLARDVICYNIALIRIGEKAVVSQGAYLCTGTHDYRKASFPLTSAPITLAAHTWVCANAFVGPGVSIHEGAILGATAAAFKDLDAWVIYSGSPAVAMKRRPFPV